MSALTTTEKKVIGQIISSMPKRERVNPVGGDLISIQSVFANRAVSIREKGVRIAETLNKLKSETESIGLPLTVSNLSRFVGILLDRWETAEKGITSWFPPMYKAVSFNPSSKDWNEWLYLLDFFSLAKILNDPPAGNSFKIPFAVLDASAYWVVNNITKRLKITGNDAIEAAVSLVKNINEDCANPPDKLTHNTRISRNAYLRAIAAEFPAAKTPIVFSVEDVWRDELFIPILAKAIVLFCQRKKDSSWVVPGAVPYRRYMQYSPWVTPLVAAEHAFLGKQTGFCATLAPAEEAVWSDIVERTCIICDVRPYVTFNYLRPATARIPYKYVPKFKDASETILKLLKSGNPETRLAEYLARLVNPFVAPARIGNEGLAQYARQEEYDILAQEMAEVVNRIHERAVKLAEDGIPETILTRIDWR